LTESLTYLLLNTRTGAGSKHGIYLSVQEREEGNNFADFPILMPANGISTVISIALRLRQLFVS
jgi:hypothetical protein